MKCLCLPFLFLVVLLTLVSPQACAASSSITTSLEMSMAESNMDLEFMMGSEFGRLLASSSGYAYTASELRSHPTFNCGRGERYCLPTKNPAGGKNCDPFNRSCH